MPNGEGKILIPEDIKAWFQDQGVTKLPDFLKPIFVVPIPVYPDWALGKKRTIVIASTAGNVQTNLSPGENKRWIIMYGYFQYIADATVANRSVLIGIEDASANLLSPQWYNSGAITAGQTIYQGIHRKGAEIKNSDQGPTTVHDFGDIIIEGTDRLNIEVTNGQAGDAYSGRLTVIEIETFVGD